MEIKGHTGKNGEKRVKGKSDRLGRMRKTPIQGVKGRIK